MEQSEATQQLAAINDAADVKAQRLRVVLRKIVLNCSVVVVAAIFSLFIDSVSVVEGTMGETPPPPCPVAADDCDECELEGGRQG